jgi:hypothetical protein
MKVISVTCLVSLNKPLSARLMPVPSLSGDQRAAFGVEYFANACVFPADPIGISGLLRGNQFIPFPGYSSA